MTTDTLLRQVMRRGRHRLRPGASVRALREGARLVRHLSRRQLGFLALHLAMGVLGWSALALAGWGAYALIR